MTLRQYADNFKQSMGTVLAVYELSKTVPAGTDPKAWVTTLCNELPQAALQQLGAFFSSTADIATFVLAAGPTLGMVAP